MLVDKGRYVRIRKHLLMPNQRSNNIQYDTSQVPLKMWIKGRLKEESELFEEVEIITATGRIAQGTLKEVDPKPKHSYGDFVNEILEMRAIILKEMWDTDDEI